MNTAATTDEPGRSKRRGKRAGQRQQNKRARQALRIQSEEHSQQVQRGYLKQNLLAAEQGSVEQPQPPSRAAAPAALPSARGDRPITDQLPPPAHAADVLNPDAAPFLPQLAARDAALLRLSVRLLGLAQQLLVDQQQQSRPVPEARGQQQPHAPCSAPEPRRGAHRGHRGGKREQHVRAQRHYSQRDDRVPQPQSWVLDEASRRRIFYPWLCAHGTRRTELTSGQSGQQHWLPHLQPWMPADMTTPSFNARAV